MDVNLNIGTQHRRSNCKEPNYEKPVCNHQEQLACRKPSQSAVPSFSHHLAKSVIIFQYRNQNHSLIFKTAIYTHTEQTVHRIVNTIPEKLYNAYISLPKYGPILM